MSEEQKKLLEQQLWNIAKTLRGKMGADEFRDYILGFIFYKYLSEMLELFADEILKPDGIKYTEVESNENAAEYLEAVQEEAIEQLGYYLKPSELFSQVAKRGNTVLANDATEEEKKSIIIIEDIERILNNIQLSTMGQDSEDDFDNLFEDMDLNSTKLGKTVEDRSELIAKVLAHLNKIDFKLEESEIDILGDAYEYLIAKFASGAGKKAGEFYTPQQVSTILARIVTQGKEKIKSAYDPTSGSGSLLLRINRHIKEVGMFYGQELNRTTYNLCRMNMILHGIHYSRFDIRQEDTLERPMHLGIEAEAIVANPPFSAKWSAKDLFLTDDRFSQYGKLAPGSKADYAFVQHMIHHLAENGTMAIVLPHGALFRGAAEAHIRQYLIEDRNYLDAVIGLPPNIFYGTSIPTCIMVFKKCRENPNDILFIDASNDFEKGKNQNTLRPQDIEKIIDTYAQRIDIEKYSHVAPMAEVVENDYNLNIPRYVDTFEEEEPVNLTAVSTELKQLQGEITENDQVIQGFCDELGIEMPF